MIPNDKKLKYRRVFFWRRTLLKASLGGSPFSPEVGLEEAAPDFSQNARRSSVHFNFVVKDFSCQRIAVNVK